MINIKNPIIFFSFIWLFVLYIYSKHYSLLLIPLKSETTIYVILTCISFLMSYLLVKLLFIQKKFTNSTKFLEGRSTNQNLTKIFKIWIIFTIIEIIYFKGLPLLSLLGIGGVGTYTEWGIPSLHGFLNAIVITLSNYFFYYYLSKKNKRYLHLYLLCLLWPIILVTRQMLLTMVVQATFIYILCNNIKIGSILKVIFSGFIIVLLFGLVGDLRSGDSDSFIQLVQPSSDYPTWLPSGFLWVYIYMVSPLNNVNFNIIKYPDFNFNLSPLISSFFPSFIREKIFPPTNQFNFQLVNENLNVSTMFPTYLDSFGYFGSLFFYFLLGLIISFFYLKFKSEKPNIQWLFFVVIILHNFIFSVFVDFFFNLVFLFQFFLHFLITKSLKLSYGKD